MRAVAILDVDAQRLGRSTFAFLVEFDRGAAVDPSQLVDGVPDEIVVGDVDTGVGVARVTMLDGTLEHPAHFEDPVCGDLARVHAVAQNAPAVRHHAAERSDRPLRVAVGLNDGGSRQHAERNVEVLEVVGSFQDPVPAGPLPLQHLEHREEILVASRVILVFEPRRVGRDVHHRFGRLAHERKIEQEHVFLRGVATYGMNGGKLRREPGQRPYRTLRLAQALFRIAGHVARKRNRVERLPGA